MNTVKLKFTGINPKIIPNIFVDGKNVKCKKNQFGSYEAQVQTENDEIELAFSRQLELKGKLWWLYALLSFIISVFGLFEPLYDRRCISTDCLFKIKLNGDEEIKVKFNTFSSSGKAVELETKNDVEEIKNSYEVDKVAKKRWIALLVVKVVVWVALAVVAGYFISKAI